MKQEQEVLLGFVNSAIEYLKQHLLTEEEGEKRDNDLHDVTRLEEEISRGFRNFYDENKESLDALRDAGAKVFDRVVKELEKKRSLIDEFADLFHPEETEEENETGDLLEPYQKEDPFFQVDEEYVKLIEEASRRAREEEADLDVDSLFAEVLAPKEEEVKEENDEIDDIFNEIVSQEELVRREEIPEEEPVTETGEEEYVSLLVDDLRRQLLEDEWKQKKENEERKILYRKINEIYPYLSQGFVRAVYDTKNAIAKEYPFNRRIILLHRLLFTELEELRQFVEIVLSHDYNVNVDENKMIVDVFKEHMNTDGRIITNIYEIANQAKLLGGEYDGYRVILKDEDEARE